jgi:PhnB protein
MKVEPYLSFDGRCEEALQFYQSALGAKVTAMMRFKEGPPPGEGGSPGCGPAAGVDLSEKIMHAGFTIGDTQIMASDGMAQGKTAFQGFSLCINTASEAEAKRLFTALAEGGQVQMPLAPTFFAKAFGIVADKFGVSWMLIFEAASA